MPVKCTNNGTGNLFSHLTATFNFLRADMHRAPFVTAYFNEGVPELIQHGLGFILHLPNTKISFQLT